MKTFAEIGSSKRHQSLSKEYDGTDNCERSWQKSGRGKETAIDPPNAYLDCIHGTRKKHG